MSGELHLSDASVAAIARRVVELLADEPGRHDLATADRPAPAGRLVWSAAHVARELGVSVDFVREHRSELGVIAQPGPRPRLLFDPEQVRAWATARSASIRPQAPDRPSLLAARRTSDGPVPNLLPIAGDRSQITRSLASPPNRRKAA